MPEAESERQMTDLETIENLKTELAEKQSVVDTLLKGFTPIDFPEVPGLAFDVVYQPSAEVENIGGDWCDVFLLPDGRVGFSLGDVCGKGITSAVKMSQARQAIKIAASLETNDPEPLPVLQQANKVLFLNNHHVDFTTAIYGIIDMTDRSVVYASAGHHPPIIARPGFVSRVMPNHGFALGVESEITPDLIKEHNFTFESGTMMVLYTDGLIEFNHDSEEGAALLLKATRTAIETKQENPARFIVDNVLHTSSNKPDDIAILTISFE